MFRSLIMLLTMPLIWGCYSAKHSIESQTAGSSLQLPRVSTIYVSVPADGVYGDKSYAGSGRMTATAFETALVHHADNVVLGKEPENQGEAFISATEASAAYLFLPKILHWEDRATEWSGKADRMELSVSVIEIATETLLDRALIKGSSSWFTFGGDHPQDMLAEPINEYVSSVFMDGT